MTQKTSVKETPNLPNDAETTIESVLPMMQPIVRWLIHSGIGYTDFVAALKPMFYQQALLELENIEHKQTDSALSLLAGLHRKDVSYFRQHSTDLQQPLALPISVPARVVGRWVALDLPLSLPFVGEKESFEALVREISTEKHPRSIVMELGRLGIVKEYDGQVILQQQSFTPDIKMNESKALFSANVADHIAAGIDNFIHQKKSFTHLEQAVFAENLTAESVADLRQLSINLWQNMATQLVNTALAHYEKDQTRANANQRFRVGVYQYDAEMPQYMKQYPYKNKVD